MRIKTLGGVRKKQAKAKVKHRKIIKKNCKKCMTKKVINDFTGMMEIKIYCDKLLYSPFEFNNYLEHFNIRGFVITTNKSQANIIMSSYQPVLNKYAKDPSVSAKLLLWTHEPYHDINTDPLIKVNKRKIHIMNVYTNNIFLNNYRYFRWSTPLLPVTVHNSNTIMIGDELKILNGRAVALSTLYEPSYYINNKFTLLPTRYEIINYGLHHHDKENDELLDVYGKGWDGIETGNSRTSKNKHNEKSEIMKDYTYNIALENTDYPNYITEKIWEPIASYILPVYYSNSTIYKDFPPNSFIDYKEFAQYDKPVEKLFEYLQQMPISEYCQRLNSCIETFNKIITLNPNKLVTCPKNSNLSIIDYSQCIEPLLYKLKSI
jgi:hypothetical protein